MTKMQEALIYYFSPVSEVLSKIKVVTSNRQLMTDLVAKLVITFGVVLIVGGLYLMISDSGSISYSASQSVAFAVNWVPGVPFYFGEVASCGTSMVGLVSWIIGLDLFLVGLGVWARHKLARFVALAMFGVAAFFEFGEFLVSGFMSAPASLFGFCVDAIVVYFLLLRFETLRPLAPASELRL